MLPATTLLYQSVHSYRRSATKGISKCSAILLSTWFYCCLPSHIAIDQLLLLSRYNSALIFLPSECMLYSDFILASLSPGDLLCSAILLKYCSLHSHFAMDLLLLLSRYNSALIFLRSQCMLYAVQWSCVAKSKSLWSELKFAGLLWGARYIAI